MQKTYDTIGREHFYRVINEVEFHKKNDKYIPNSELKHIVNYYKRYGPGNYKFYSYLYALKLKDVVESIINSQKQLTVLDAGCGVGSESILFSSLGAKVTGVDLEGKFINIAKKRLLYYKDFYDLDLDLTFYNKDIFKFDTAVDAVWAHNFISHVYSVEKFIGHIHNNLNPNGTLTICDSNKLNPYVFLSNTRVHMITGDHVYRVDPDTGEKIKCAMEVNSSPSELVKLLEKENFTIESVRIFGFLPNMLSNTGVRVKITLDKLCGKVPFLNKFGVFYSITGRKT